MKSFNYIMLFSNHALIYTDLKFILISFKKSKSWMAGTFYSDSFLIVSTFPIGP